MMRLMVMVRLVLITRVGMIMNRLRLYFSDRFLRVMMTVMLTIKITNHDEYDENMVMNMMIIILI